MQTIFAVIVSLFHSYWGWCLSDADTFYVFFFLGFAKFKNNNRNYQNKFKLANTTLSVATCLLFLVYGFIFIVVFGHVSWLIPLFWVCFFGVFEFDLPIMNARFIVSLELKWRIVLNFIDHTYTRALAEWRDFKLFGTACLKHCFVVMFISCLLIYFGSLLDARSFRGIAFNRRVLSNGIRCVSVFYAWHI